jgi:hypothetical protein
LRVLGNTEGKVITQHKFAQQYSRSIGNDS